MSKHINEDTHENSRENANDKTRENPNARPASVNQAPDSVRYFGPKVRELREHYHTRLAEHQNAALLGKKSGLTASAVVDCLKHSGYVLSLPSFGEIEAGGNLPRDAARFLSIIERCLNLQPDERRDLEHRLAYDILHARMGDRASLVLTPPETQAQQQRQPSMLGVVLRDLRQSGGLKVEELAEKLFAHGFALNARELHVLDRLRLSPTSYLAGQLVDIEQSTVQAPWPFELPPNEFVALVASCLPAHLLAEQRLRHALSLDELSLSASGPEGPRTVR